MLLVGKPERKRPLIRPGRRWANKIKIDLGEIGWFGKDWLRLAQDSGKIIALLNTVMYFGFHKVLENPE
jgi:hypothetical protein